MNLRFWGGWFLAIAVISVVLTMGCEKGALGVKPALVTGRIVDDDSGGAINSATVRMMSKEKSGSGEFKQGQNYLTTITGADGRFVFENVAPDNVVFEYFARNYNQAMFPVTTTATDEEGNETAAAGVDAVYVKSGAVVNLGDLRLKSLASSPLAATMTARIDLVDNTTRQQIDGNLEFTISFNGQAFRKTANEWRTNGVQDLPSSRSLKVLVRHEPTTTSMLYVSNTVDYDVTGDLIEIIYLEPVTYSLQLRSVNVPDYIRGGVVNIYAEKPTDGTTPPQVLARQTINDLGTLGAPNLPALVEVPGLAMPVDLRIQVRGYEDEVLKIDAANLPEGSQGNYRVDIDFLGNNGATTTTYNPVTNNTAALFDNMLTRNVRLVVAGEDLQTGHYADALINLPYKGTKEYRSGLAVDTLNPVPSAATNMPVNVTFQDVAVGYDLFYTATVWGSATGSYNVSNSEGIMISPEVQPGASTLVIGVDAKRPAN